MEITVNGDILHFDTPANIPQLITRLELSNVKIAIELNKQILPRSEYAQKSLQEGDILEIVQAIGGG
ncbi:MAG: thiamine biosynthesis protein ThiS [SAR86 cluster bacterium]|uniref:Thiamine biosynthesis protein ThiS n=1 Tax=SAR86 cluster bacterium TaxID=2030880 RepID=A0A2A4MP57_9GAMM|nr:MAG: thiamine biosynthesis protein ThiS [SAR86 cluster bacterium]